MLNDMIEDVAKTAVMKEADADSSSVGGETQQVKSFFKIASLKI